MARPRRTSAAPPVSSGQASYVLERLIEERRISPGEVSRYVSDMHQEIGDLERRLNMLREAAGATETRGQTGIRPAPARGRRRGQLGRSPTKTILPPPPTPPGGKRRGRPPGSKNRVPSTRVDAGNVPVPSKLPPYPVRRRRRTRITPEQLASRQLQGRYLGLIRQIPASKRKVYQKIAKDKGREAAIQNMAAALGK